MHDLFFVGFLAAFLALGFRRPFLFVLAYVYVDIVSPQRLSYFLLNAVPVSLICVALAVAGWIVADDKAGARFGLRQALLCLILAWAGFTTLHADFPIEALDKWGWVWKALAFAIFLPLTLSTRLRIEALLTTMILSASSIIIVGGVKTLASGGGYGTLNLGLDNNSGLYEGSTASTVAVAIVPVILWLMRFGTIWPRDLKLRLFGGALIFACLLIPIGTQTRTGLLCIGLLAVLMLRATRRRLLYLCLLAAAGLVAVPLLPKSYTQRMDTIGGYQGDESAETRVAVWQWTWDYAKSHPLGGGFEAYRQNRLVIDVKPQAPGADAPVQPTFDQSRAYHNSFFEMLGEQGYPGAAMWILLHLLALLRMEAVRRRYRHAEEGLAWAAPLATALQHAHLVYLLGAMFVGIAFQPFVFQLLAAGIGLDGYLRRRTAPARAPLGGAAGPRLAQA